MVEHRASLDHTFAALADPTRRAILGRLRHGPRTVSALAQPFEISLAAISKHLTILERAGLIRRHVAGREHHCHLRSQPLREAAKWASYLAQWEERLDALEEHLKESAAPRRAQRRRQAARRKT